VQVGRNARVSVQKLAGLDEVVADVPELEVDPAKDNFLALLFDTDCEHRHLFMERVEGHAQPLVHEVGSAREYVSGLGLGHVLAVAEQDGGSARALGRESVEGQVDGLLHYISSG
jgi:hypothetical protein